MKAHERFRAVATGKPFDRLPVMEWAPWWSLTVDRWHQEDPTLADAQGAELQRRFGLDIQAQSWFRLTGPETPRPPGHGAPIVRNMDDYQKIRPTLYPEPRVDDDTLKFLRQLYATGEGVAWYTVDGFFWGPRELLGIEPHLYSFYDEPELYREICRDLLAWHKKIVAYCAEKFPFTYMTFAEDMSYNNGPMISREIFDEFIAPYYRQILPDVKAAGVLAAVDSDGDITKAVDWFRACGIDGMFPLERQAGVDIGLYIDKHPEIFFLGHFDKMVMDKGDAALDAEFARLFPSAARGRYIPSVDHQTPPGVSVTRYRDYVARLKRFAVEVAKARGYI